MTARDRIVLLVVGALAILGAFWMLVLSPKRKEATDLDTQITAVQQRLQTAQASAAAAEGAKARYDADYATVARLGKAVPVEDDVPSLLYQLETTAHANKVDFRKIDLNTSGAAAAPVSQAAAAVASANGTTPAGSASAVASALPPGATVGPAGFPTMPFTFDFQGSFFSMQKFLHAIDGLTSIDGKTIKVKGRLLTIDGFDLKAGPNGFPDVDANIAATAYLLPADEGLTAGATPGSPTTGATVAASTTTAAPASNTSASLHGSN